MAVNITTDTNTVKVIAATTNNVKIVDNKNNTTVSVSQPTTRVIKVATIGPQGPAGAGASINTGSFATTGSNTFYGLQTLSASSASPSVLDIHAKDEGLWAFRIYNDTYSSTSVGLASWIDNTGVSFLGTETNKPLYVYTNAQYYQPTLVISSSGITSPIGITAPSFIGSLQGTASYAATASYVNPLNQNVKISGSLHVRPNTTSSVDLLSVNKQQLYEVVTTGQDTSFQNNYQAVNPNRDIYTCTILSNGNFLIGGRFNDSNNSTPNSLAQINANGTANTTFNTNIEPGGAYGTGFNNAIYSTLVQSSGKIVVGGLFNDFNTNTRNRLTRVDSDGNDDGNFYVNLGNAFGGEVYVLAANSNEDIFVGGAFTSFNGNGIVGLVKLDVDGNQDMAFSTNLGSGFTDGFTNGTIYAIEVQSDGQIIVGGNFFSFNGNSKRLLMRLNSDGTEDTTFYSNYTNGPNGSGGLGGTVYSIKVQSDGKILVGGEFTSYNGDVRNYLIRLNADGTEDTTFYTNLENAFFAPVRSIKVQLDQKILVGGDFTYFNGNSRNHIVRLNADGTEDTAFYSLLGNAFSDIVYSIATDSSGNIAIAGAFKEYNTVGTSYLIKLSSTINQAIKENVSINKAPDNNLINIQGRNDDYNIIDVVNYNGIKVFTLNKSGSLAQGINTWTYGDYSHAQGEQTNTYGRASHAEGISTQARGDFSHAEGDSTYAYGIASHTEGLGTDTRGDYQLAIGQYNKTSTAQSAFIIGNGTFNNRSNLLFASGSQVQITGSLLITGSLTMSPSSSFILPLSASTSPQKGSAYWSGSFLFVYNGTRYMSASFF